MGGQHCEIPWKAVVRFTEVPERRGDQQDLETQLREALTVPSIYDGLVEDGHGQAVCEIMAKDDMTPEDLKKLLYYGKKLWADYAATPPP